MLSHDERHANTPSHFSSVWLSATPWTIAHQTPPSTGFSSQEYWSELPCSPPGDLPDPPRDWIYISNVSCAGRWVLGPPEKPIMMNVFVQIHRILTPQVNLWLWCVNICSSIVIDIPLWREMLIMGDYTWAGSEGTGKFYLPLNIAVNLKLHTHQKSLKRSRNLSISVMYTFPN